MAQKKNISKEKFYFVVQKIFLQNSIENKKIIISMSVCNLCYIFIFYDFEMEFEGIITMIWTEENVWQNNSRKVTFVIEEDTDKDFKWSVAVDLWNDKVDLIKTFNQWDKVKVWLNFRAREYNGRWFNGVSARRIDKLDWTSAPKAAPAEDDLPF